VCNMLRKGLNHQAAMDRVGEQAGRYCASVKQCGSEGVTAWAAFKGHRVNSDCDMLSANGHVSHK